MGERRHGFQRRRHAQLRSGFARRSGAVVERRRRRFDRFGSPAASTLPAVSSIAVSATICPAGPTSWRQPSGSRRHRQDQRVGDQLGGGFVAGIDDESIITCVDLGE